MMQKIQPFLPDAMIVAGVGAIAYGAWLIHPAAGFITGGAIVLALGIRSARVLPPTADAAMGGE